MIRLRKNLKFKRVMSFLLVLIIFSSTLLADLIKAPVVVKADSNNTRSVFMNLAANGRNQTKINSYDIASQIDSASLRVIALWLSNFYLPWQTSFDSKYDSEAEDDDKKDDYNAVTSDYRDNAIAALVEQCGMDKKSAGYLVEYIIQQNLSTCHEFLMRKSDLRMIWIHEYLKILMHETGASAVSELLSLGLTSLLTDVGYKVSSIGFVNRCCFSVEGTISGWGLGADPLKGHSVFSYANGSDLSGASSSLDYKSGFDNYVDYFGTTTIAGVDYVPVTYPVFLSVMNLCYKVASVDSVKENYSSSSNFMIANYWGDFETYDVTNRPDSVSQKDGAYVGYSKESDSVMTNDEANTLRSRVPLIQFYTEVNNSASPVFSNNEECMQAFAMVYNYVDLNNGYGSGFLSLNPDSEVFSKACKGNLQPAINTTVLAAKIYVNWIGDLVVDTGRLRVVAFPGCANPYVFSVLDPKYYRSTIPAQNLYTIASKIDNYLDYNINNRNEGNLDGTGMTQGGKEGKKSFKLWVNSGEDTSIFNLTRWRCCIGAGDAVAFDTKCDGYGTAEGLEDIIKRSGLGGANYKPFSDDRAYFPSWDNIAQSVTYKNTYEQCAVNVKESDLEPNIKSTLSDNFARLGARDLYGHTVWNDCFAYLDTFAGVTSDDDTLSSLFNVDNIVKGDVIKNVSATNLKINISSTNSLLNTYNNSNFKSLFTSLFLTYCLAYWNEEANATSVSTDTDGCNFIDLRTNLSNFPAISGAVDWATIFAGNRAEEVVDFAYFFLHPTQGISMVANWIKNKIGGFLLKWHEDIVGSTDSNSSTGVTKYLGYSGYTTVPSLDDIDWVQQIMNYYQSMIVFLIVLICLIMLCYILTGSLTIQRGIIGIIMFGILAFLPPLVINATINKSNEIASSLYSKKFDYWALCQLQNYLEELKQMSDAKSLGDRDTYAALVLSNQNNTLGGIAGTTTTAYTGVKLKWMCPKKYASSAALKTALDKATEGTGAEHLKSMFMQTSTNLMSAETFLDDESNALYLYRDYTDIYRYSAGSYNLLSTYNLGGKLTSDSPSLPVSTPNINAIANFINTNNSRNSINTNIEYYEKSLGGKNDFHAEYSSGKNIKDFVYGNSGQGTGAYAETSSLRALENGFLYDTIDFEKQKEGNKDKIVKYYGFTTGIQKNTLSSAYLLNYNKAWDYAAKQRERLSKIANEEDHDISVEIDTITDPNSGSMNSNNLLGFSLDCYMGNSSGINGIQAIEGMKDGLGDNIIPTPEGLWGDLSFYYYGLYTESPFYFFNFNLRDQINSIPGEQTEGKYYLYDPSDPTNTSPTTESGMNLVNRMLLEDNQSYFFNLKNSAGDGYGELRDFMNMHDLFYYVIPCMQQGVDLARLFDSIYGFYIDEDVAVSYNSAEGNLLYNNKSMTFSQFITEHYNTDEFTDEQKYKIWHTLSMYSILQAYSPWLDTMLDCDYAKPENITVQGERFKVANPLDPTSYFTVNRKGEMSEGRFMVFSRSEMKYYGLNASDLTAVERKIIEVQDNVYEKALDLMNYYTLSDETLIQALSMLEIFEFNKVFSQEKLLGKSYIMYPQGYELKAFTYDAYLRLILAEASGEDLQTDSIDTNTGNIIDNVSIYSRIQSNTSLFFSIFLLLDDVAAVYIIPALKLAFVMLIFFTSVLLIIASAVKLELNMVNVLYRSLFRPMAFFFALSVALSYFVSLFMTNGANGVVSSGFAINLGDPTTTIIVMLITNVIYVVLYFKLVFSCWKDCVSYAKAVGVNIGGAVTGAANGVVNGLASGVSNFAGTGSFRGDSSSGRGAASTAEQRGRDNSPFSGKHGLAGIAGGAAAFAGGALTAKALSDSAKGGSGGSGGSGGGSGGAGAGTGNGDSSGGMDDSYAADKFGGEEDPIVKAKKVEAERRKESVGLNKWDKKVHEGASIREDKAFDKFKAKEKKLEQSANRYGLKRNKDGSYNTSDIEALSAAKRARFKRQQLAADKQKRKSEEAEQYRKDVAGMGRFAAKRKQIGTKLGNVKNGVYAKEAGGRLSVLGNSARAAGSTATVPFRAVGNGVKKGKDSLSKGLDRRKSLRNKQKELKARGLSKSAREKAIREYRKELGPSLADRVSKATRARAKLAAYSVGAGVNNNRKGYHSGRETYTTSPKVAARQKAKLDSLRKEK